MTEKVFPSITLGLTQLIWSGEQTPVIVYLKVTVWVPDD
jgi:hypothetical protein